MDAFMSRIHRSGTAQAWSVIGRKQYANLRSQKGKTTGPVKEEKWGPKRSRRAMIPSNPKKYRSYRDGTLKKFFR